jgi:type I restriction enzyme S subunit
VSASTASEYRDFYLQPDDVLLVMVGATTGKLGFVREKDLPALLNQNMWCLRTKEQFWDKGFFEFLIFREIQRFLGTQQGSARDFLTQKQFGSFLVPVPPISEQKVMAESLQATSLVLDSETTKLTTLQQLKKGLMHDLLTGRVRVLESSEAAA